MSTMQDQMRLDSYWIKPNPATDIALTTRTHGQHYIYNYAPNAKERIEMSMRSLGRQYDWDLEKFRLDRKPADRGNKRRFFKNAARFFKNPIGYSSWKLRKLKVGGRMSMAVFYILFPAVFCMSYVESAFENKETNFFVALGDKINGPRGMGVGQYDQSAHYPTNFFSSIPLTQCWGENYVANSTYKMNYRKHRETLNRNKEAIFKYFNASSMEEAHSRNFGFN